jgi:hypothetical protein
VRLQEIGGHERRDETRHGKAHQHGDDDGEAEILEELARNAGHQPDGKEHGNDRHRGGEHGKPDLVGASIDA